MIKTIDVDEILRKVEQYLDCVSTIPASDRFLFIEIGPSSNFDQIHLPHAIHMELSQVKQVAQDRMLNLGKEIILYSDKNHTDAVENAANILSNLGYSNLYIFVGGKEDWLSKGLGSQTSLVPADNFNLQPPVPFHERPNQAGRSKGLKSA